VRPLRRFSRLLQLSYPFRTPYPSLPSPPPARGPPVSPSGPNFSLGRHLNIRLCHLPSPLNLAALLPILSLSLSLSLSAAFFLPCRVVVRRDDVRLHVDMTLKRDPLLASRTHRQPISFVSYTGAVEGRERASIIPRSTDDGIIDRGSRSSWKRDLEWRRIIRHGVGVSREEGALFVHALVR